MATEGLDSVTEIWFRAIPPGGAGTYIERVDLLPSLFPEGKRIPLIVVDVSDANHQPLLEELFLTSLPHVKSRPAFEAARDRLCRET